MLTQITGTLFTRWMKACGAVRIDDGNAFQIVAILIQDKWGEHEAGHGTGSSPPNWHLTMMGNRDSTVSINFHFKAEIGKPFSHYWHYVLHRDAAAHTWHWVGDPNPQIPATNQGGGGAGANHQLLKSNLSLVEMALRGRSTLETGMNNKKRNKLLAKLNKWDKEGVITAALNGVCDGGSSI
ncbi:MAG: hypothetical protein RQ966_04335 [Acetobacteraceae bacterium]|nr:hypothetical protein [Acetobacteraceae bacterium]